MDVFNIFTAFQNPASSYRNQKTTLEKLKFLLKNLFYFFNIFVMIVYIITCLLLIVRTPFNITYFALGFMTSIQINIAIIKMLILLYNRDKLKMTVSMITQGYSVDQQRTFKIINLVRIFTIYRNQSITQFCINVILFMSVFITRAFTDKYDFIGKMPIESSNIFINIILTVSANYAAFPFLLTNLVSDIVINKLTTNLSIEFKILAYKFEHLNEEVNERRNRQLYENQARLKNIQKSKNPSKNQIIPLSHPSTSNEKPETPKQTKFSFQMELDDLKPLIIRHNQLFECHKILQETFCVVFLLNFIIAAIIICTVAFMVTIKADDRFFYVPILIRDLYKTFFLCFFGQMLKDASLSVSKGVESIKWEDIEDQDVKKSILFIMIRSQKAACLQITKDIQITAELFTKILTSAYSYYTFCLHIYKRN